MFLGLPKPDPLVKDMDPDPGILKVIDVQAGSGSISQRYGCADPDPH